MALSMLVQGSTGPEVENLQRGLNYHLPDILPELKVDRIFGPKTKARLMEFQKRVDLKPDGVLGPLTQPLLYSFVEYSHHLLPRDRRLARKLGIRQVSDTPMLPPVPRLELPFPQPFRPPPPPFRPPRLELDPVLMNWLNARPFEVAAGTNLVFRKEKAGADAFLDVTATAWSAPIVPDHLEFSTGVGVAGEVRVADGHREASVVYFIKTELKDVTKFRSVDLLKMQLEGRLETKPGSKEPPDLKATLKAGPSIETGKNGLSFGFGGYMEYKSNPQTHEWSGGVFIEGSYRF